MNAKPKPERLAGGLEEIFIAAIEPHPDNPRTFPAKDADDAGLVELAASIREVGLLEPVLVRPLQDDGNLGGLPRRYQLVAGERRWRACRLAGLERIPAIVRELDDTQALEVLVTENLQREDLGPLEEARGVRALVDRAGWTAKDVADRLGRSLHWVAQRARLTELSAAWRKEVENPKSMISVWPAAWLVLIARLDPAAQDDLLKEEGSWWRRESTDLGMIQSAVADLTRFVHSAPWKKDDAALFPDAGACNACSKRSSCNPGLFDDDDLANPGRKDRCLDAGCWNEKRSRFLKAEEARLRAEHPKLLLVHGSYDESGVRTDHNRKDVIPDWSYTRAKKGESGASPAFVVDGKGAGRLEWIRTRASERGSAAARPKGPDGKPAPKSLKERRVALDRRRKALAVENIKAQLREAPTPPNVLLIQLAAVFGTMRKRDTLYEYLRDDDGKPLPPAWKRFDQLDSQSVGGTSSSELLWDGVRAVLAARLTYLGSQTDMARLWSDAEDLAETLGFDTASALAAGVEAIPEPKSWAGLGADGKPKGAKPRKAAADKPKKKRAAKPKIQTCRVCGCTEDDCSQCVEKTGEPCSWVEKDLCSACATDLDEDEGEAADAAR